LIAALPTPNGKSLLFWNTFNMVTNVETTAEAKPAQLYNGAASISPSPMLQGGGKRDAKPAQLYNGAASVSPSPMLQGGGKRDATSAE
jgi:hypothetical protein